MWFLDNSAYPVVFFCTHIWSCWIGNQLTQFLISTHPCLYPLSFCVYPQIVLMLFKNWIVKLMLACWFNAFFQLLIAFNLFSGFEVNWLKKATILKPKHITREELKNCNSIIQENYLQALFLRFRSNVSY